MEDFGSFEINIEMQRSQEWERKDGEIRAPEEEADQKHKQNPRLDPCFQELFLVKRADWEMPVISGSARR